MKKILYALLATVSGVVLLFSYRTSTGAEIPTSGTATHTAGTASGSTASGTASGSIASGTAAVKDGVYTGPAESNPYGQVQVRVTVSGGRVTAVNAPQYPSGNGRSQQISSVALPQLAAEALKAQSARIDMVSGATYTSTGYQQSLQQALDQAAR